MLKQKCDNVNTVEPISNPCKITMGYCNVTYAVAITTKSNPNNVYCPPLEHTDVSWSVCQQIVFSWFVETFNTNNPS